MNIKVQVWSVRMIPVFIVIYFIGFGGVSGFLPPPSPRLTGMELSTLFAQKRLAIQCGQIICLASSILYLPWCAVMSAQMAKVEGPFPILAILQCLGAVLLEVYFIFCSMIWIVASYRPDVDPRTLRMLDDMAWLTFVMVYPEFVMQLLAIALVGFMDKRTTPLLPRWACFVTLWVAIAGIGGGFACIFTTGPFAWNGIIGFWIPIVCYVGWLLCIAYPLLMKAVVRHDSTEIRLTRVFS